MKISTLTIIGIVAVGTAFVGMKPCLIELKENKEYLSIAKSEREPWYDPNYATYVMYYDADNVGEHSSHIAYFFVLTRLLEYCHWHVDTLSDREQQFVREMYLGILHEFQEVYNHDNLLSLPSDGYVGCIIDMFLFDKQNLSAEIRNSWKKQNREKPGRFISYLESTPTTREEKLDCSDDEQEAPEEEEMSLHAMERAAFRALTLSVAATDDHESPFFQGLDGVLCGIAAHNFLWSRYMGLPAYSERITHVLFSYMKGASESRLLQAFWAIGFDSPYTWRAKCRKNIADTEYDYHVLLKKGGWINLPAKKCDKEQIRINDYTKKWLQWLQSR